MKKKILAALLAALMLICAVSVGALSSDEVIVLDSTNGYTLDVKIHLKGDINGDGKVNVIDVGKANAHAKKASSLVNYEFDCADVNNDGKVNIIDVGKINAHAKKTNPLW